MAVSAASARPAASDMEGVAPLDAPRPFFRAPESQAKSVNSIGQSEALGTNYMGTSLDMKPITTKEQQSEPK